jgi:hypothetical protein
VEEEENECVWKCVFGKTERLSLEGFFIFTFTFIFFFMMGLIDIMGWYYVLIS